MVNVCHKLTTCNTIVEVIDGISKVFRGRRELYERERCIDGLAFQLLGRELGLREWAEAGPWQRLTVAEIDVQDLCSLCFTVVPSDLCTVPFTILREFSSNHIT